jgi:hypothetical protein
VQQEQFQTNASDSRTTANSTKRKRKSREELADEQRISILEQNRNIYATQQEQIREQTLKIACCNIDDFNKNIVNGNETENNRHNLKEMNNICNKCQALRWNNETKGFCCQNGQVVLAPLPPASSSLFILLTANDPILNTPYVSQIRSYNQVLAFTSLGANIDKELANAQDGVYTFRIQGELYHQIGELMPKDYQKPSFAQIYFYNTDLDNQLEWRKQIFSELNSVMLKELQAELHEKNPFVKSFTNAVNRAKEISKDSNMRLIIHNTHGKDMRQYNQPTSSEVAVIMLDSDNESNVRDIVLKTHEEKLQRISELNLLLFASIT